MNIGDLFLRLLVDASDFERQVVAQGTAAGNKAGAAMGSSIATNLAKASSQIGATLGSVGQSLARTGRGMTTGLTLPLVAAGAALTHFALDFDTTLRRVVGLTDVTAEEIDGIRESILRLGPEVGKTPQELAEAFYFVASAGFKASEAMDVLETAARASAAGLGETQTIAQVLGSVINAYGKENITASRAADILTEAVSQGTAESTEFAGVIGRVVPAAAAMGVSFDQVAAALAAMTLSGLSAEEAAVGLNQVLVSLLKPTTQAVDAMTQLGLTSEGLRKQLREEGLLSTLRTLEERFAGNEAAAAAVFGNIRALRTVTNLLNLDSEQLNQVFGKVEDSLGRLSEAYDETEGPQRDLDRAMAELEASAIALGEDLLPQVTGSVEDLSGALREFTKLWKSLDDGTQQFIVSAGMVLAVIGPLVWVFGKLFGAVGALFKGFGWLVGVIPKLAGALGGLSVAAVGALGVIGLIVAAAVAAGAAWSDYMRRQKPVEASFIRLGTQAGRFYDRISQTAVRGARELGITVEEFKERVVEYAEATGAGWEAAVDAVMTGADAAVDAMDGASIGMNERWARAWLEVGDTSRRGAEDMVDVVATVLEDGSVEISDAADTMADPIADAIADARAKAGEETRGMINDLATILDTAPEELEDELDEFFEALGKPFTTARRLAVLEGQAARSEWAASFASGDPQAEAAAFNKFSTDVLDQLELLLPDVFEVGGTVPTSFMEGMVDNVTAAVEYLQGTGKLGEFVNAFDLADQLDAMGETVMASYVRGMETERVLRIPAFTQTFKADLARRMRIDLYGEGYTTGTSFGNGLKGAQGYINDKADQIKAGVTRILQFEGSPPYTHSRLIGLRVGKSWGVGIASAIESILPQLASVFGQAAGIMATAPAFAGGLSAYPSAGLTLPPIGAAPGGEVNSVVNNYNLNVTGKLGVDEAQDAVDEMRRLQSFTLASSGR